MVCLTLRYSLVASRRFFALLTSDLAAAVHRQPRTARFFVSFACVTQTVLVLLTLAMLYLTSSLLSLTFALLSLTRSVLSA